MKCYAYFEFTALDDEETIAGILFVEHDIVLVGVDLLVVQTQESDLFDVQVAEPRHTRKEVNLCFQQTEEEQNKSTIQLSFQIRRDT